MAQPITATATLTRTTGTTQYTSGDVIAQSGTAGSCAAAQMRVGQIPNPDFPGDGFLTVLAVANQSGTLPGQPGLTYGDGTPLPVHIFGSGDARYVGVPGVTLEGSRNGRRRAGTVAQVGPAAPMGVWHWAHGTSWRPVKKSRNWRAFLCV